MEPIKINIEVNLGEATLTLLKSFVPGTAPVPATAVTTAPAPASPPESATEPNPAEGDDLPIEALNGAQTLTKATPTEDDARQAVKAARTRGVAAKAIKDFMKETFDIASSVECPAERRQELIDGLNKLAA